MAVTAPAACNDGAERTPSVLSVEARRWLESSRFGVLEPSKFHPSATPDVLILPLLAFDHHGMRLGYGGGTTIER